MRNNLHVIIKTIIILVIVTALLVFLAFLVKENKPDVNVENNGVYEVDSPDENELNNDKTQGTESNENEEIQENESKENEEVSIDENLDDKGRESMFNTLTAEDREMINEKINSMTLHEKVCQMVIAWPEQISGAAYPQTTSDGVADGLKKYPVGGIIYFAANLTDPEQTKAMLATTQKASLEASGLKLFTCIDEEGGNTLRIAQNPSFGLKATGAMESMKSEEEVREAAKYIGDYLKELGFNFDFAPDADVITNPLNQIIGSRSFGTDPEWVSKMSKAYSDGLHEAGILSSYKHFPGHGSTEGDTHEGFAFTNKSLEELKAADLIPFASAQEAGADSVMIAHISLPEILGDNTPCTLSKEIITDLLRDQLEYQGLIITDALNMKAITSNYDPAQAAVMTVKAGSDIVLMPAELETAVEAIKGAVLAGDISEDRINQSLIRILEMKARLK